MYESVNMTAYEKEKQKEQAYHKLCVALDFNLQRGDEDSQVHLTNYQLSYLRDLIKTDLNK